MIALALVSCHPAAAAAVAPAPLPAAAVNMSGPTSREMANCPSTVGGATTRLAYRDRALELSIEGPPRVVAEIRRLAAYQLEIHVAPRDRTRHTGRGTGGGQTGYCPIVHPGTDLEVTELERGVRVTVTPRDPRQARRLREVTASRLQAVRTRTLQSLIDPPRPAMRW